MMESRSPAVKESDDSQCDYFIPTVLFVCLVLHSVLNVIHHFCAPPVHLFLRTSDRCQSDRSEGDYRRSQNPEQQAGRGSDHEPTCYHWSEGRGGRPMPPERTSVAQQGGATVKINRSMLPRDRHTDQVALPDRTFGSSAAILIGTTARSGFCRLKLQI